jgi:hypothetical protein
MAALVLVGLEAVALVLVGLNELRVLTGSRATMGVTTALFFVVYGVGLGIVAWQLRRLRSWARAPAVLAQLIQICVAWSFRGGSTTLVAAVLAVVAVLALAGIFHPASIAAVDASDADAADPSGRHGV